MRIDLHTHSSVSDGTDDPTTLVRHAAASGLDVVALTDHDTAEGWSEAAAAAAEVGITLVRGMEISTALGHASVHLLGYLPDPTYPPLATALDKILDGRNSRVPGICARLQALGFDVTAEDVRRRAIDAAATGRPHVADVMVAAGMVASRDEAFERFLNPGRPAYVDRYAVPLHEAISLVAASGGVSVLAHPWGRGRAVVLPEARLSELRDAGLVGIEVDHQDHPPAARDALRAIARNLDLVVTGSSDHHGTGKTDHDLGCNTTAPEEYARLLDLAAESARASGRPAPGVLA
ncbi:MULTISPECIES: PHP domain-containing protein [Nocardioides]|uniref:PHP domain-containing protein n=1 Tax=Nocardioides TaxID=1839 RepID=UPI00032E4D21|nr:MULTISPECIES: PHP domain-containing protein [Nocardioides]EON24735.1 phosphotransferase domain-containing protein [Nocardioides sp. CF8]